MSLIWTRLISVISIDSSYSGMRVSLVGPSSVAEAPLLHREKDVGRPKAIAAAEFVMKRVPGVTVTPYVLAKFSIGLTNALLRYHGKIQDKDEEYYKQFQIIICGLDSIEARRWINATLVGMVDEDDPDSLKPLIDGGTEGALPTNISPIPF
jgi:molybdopterin/thiamine biosynthesis adenylyltransferase